MSWYTDAGVTLGAFTALVCTLAIVIDVFDGSWRNWVWHRVILCSIPMLTAWWWLPWVFYAISFLPAPTMPPDRTDSGQTQRVAPLPAERIK